MAGLTVACLAGFLAQRNSVARLRRENDRLTEELLATRQSASAAANTRSERQSAELERLRTEAREVHKLRNEINQLREGAKRLDELRTENRQLRTANEQLRAMPRTGAAAAPAAAQPEGYYPKESWVFAGYSTPEAALQSIVWAMREGDTGTFLAGLTPEEVARMQEGWGDKTEAEISADSRKGADKIRAVRILERQALSDDEIVLSIYAEGGEDRIQKISMKRFGGDWKMAGPRRD